MLNSPNILLCHQERLVCQFRDPQSVHHAENAFDM